MVDRFVPIVAAIVVMLFALGSACHAQPASIASLASEATFDQADRNAIKAFAEYWIDRLGSNSPNENGENGERHDGETASRARGELIQPLLTPGVTIQFRELYSDAAIEPLRGLLGAKDAQAANNAATVLAYLGTEDALERLLASSSPQTEPRWFVRLPAARACRVLFSRANLTLLRANDITSAARRLRNAARDETDARTLHYQLQAILSADMPVLPGSARAQVREYFVDALNSVAERVRGIEAREVTPLMTQLISPLSRVRTTYLELPRQDQVALGRKLGPALASLLDSLIVNWAQLHADTESLERIGLVVQVSETLLWVIDPIVGGGPRINSGLANAWRGDDLQAYQRDIDHWRERTGNPPYEPP
jgi:hypothetical protein